ncbi:MAG: hydrolase [Myxococcaceae bacterium]|nr:hydrolase [Myxococcaceae bacterium]
MGLPFSASKQDRSNGKRSRGKRSIAAGDRIVKKLRGDTAPKRVGGKGEPLVLLHPFALCAEVWRPILPMLEQHHEVFALPIPGHAGSDPLPQGYEYSVEAAVDLLEAKLDSLGIERAHLVGNSLGGWLAIELARRGRALSVTALAPGGGWEAGSPELTRLLRRFHMTKLLLSFGGAIASRLARWALPRRYFLRDAVARPEQLTPLEARLLIESTWRCAVYGDILKVIPTQPLAEPFAQLPCPVRLVWGAEDRLLPMRGYSERWRRVLPGAEWVTLPNVGHVQMYDDPEAVAASILDCTKRAEQTARREERRPSAQSTVMPPAPRRLAS